MRYTFIAAMMTIVLTVPSASDASSNRSRKRIGVQGGYNIPYPAVGGIGLAFNPSDWARMHVRVGLATMGTNFSVLNGEIKFFIPDISLSPTAGIAYSNYGTGYYKEWHAIAGIDFQHSKGYNIGAGYIVPFKKQQCNCGLIEAQRDRKIQIYIGKFFSL